MIFTIEPLSYKCLICLRLQKISKNSSINNANFGNFMKHIVNDHPNELSLSDYIKNKTETNSSNSIMPTSIMQQVAHQNETAEKSAQKRKERTREYKIKLQKFLQILLSKENFLYILLRIHALEVLFELF